MSKRDEYPPGVPCWVENLQRDVAAGRDFYTKVLGWEWDGPGPGEYHVARSSGADVAGLAPAPDGVAPAWMTHVRVESAAGAVRRARAAGGSIVAGPLDIAPAGRMAVLADPTGALLCAFEPGVRRGAQRVNEPGAWAMSILTTPDPERAAAFYGDLLGWETQPYGPMLLFRLPGYIGGEPLQPVPRDVVAAMATGEPARWDVDFWVSDIDAAVAAAADAGGQALCEVHDAPPFRRAVLADPGGAVLSISRLVG